MDKWSLAGLIAALRGVDRFPLVFAGLFIILGFVWPPAYIVAGLTVAFAVSKALGRRQRYMCFNCKRAFTYEEVQGK